MWSGAVVRRDARVTITCCALVLRSLVAQPAGVTCAIWRLQLDRFVCCRNAFLLCTVISGLCRLYSSCPGHCVSRLHSHHVSCSCLWVFSCAVQYCKLLCTLSSLHSHFVTGSRTCSLQGAGVAGVTCVSSLSWAEHPVIVDGFSGS